MKLYKDNIGPPTLRQWRQTPLKYSWLLLTYISNTYKIIQRSISGTELHVDNIGPPTLRQWRQLLEYTAGYF